MSDGEPNFAAFEAEANSAEPTITVHDRDVEAKDLNFTEPKPEPQAGKPLDLTDGDEAVDVPEDDPEGETDPAEPRRRSKPASQRIAELTAKLRQAERELEASRAPKGETAAPEAPKKPDPADFEFGEADPAFVDALVDWKLETRDAERGKVDGAKREQEAITARIETGVAKAEAEASAKYEDFETKIAEAVEARGGEPLPPIVSIGIGMSPVGGDIIYRLATDPEASKRLETLAKAPNHNATAMAFGELEGEYLADADDNDLDISDPLDMARMMGRMRARLRGKPAEKAKPAVVVTNAPEPPEGRARGSSGQFEVTADTTDFAAFEKKAMAKR